MISQFAFATSLAFLTGVPFLLFVVLDLVAPSLSKFLFNAPVAHWWRGVRICLGVALQPAPEVLLSDVSVDVPATAQNPAKTTHRQPTSKRKTPR